MYYGASRPWGQIFLFLGVVLTGVGLASVGYHDASMETWFHEPDIAGFRAITDPIALRYVAQKALAHLQAKMAKNPTWGQKAALSAVVDPALVAKTLAFVIRTIDQDTQAGRSQRILDPSFLRQQCTFLSWDGGAAKGPGTVRLTHYALFHAQGSLRQTASHSCPLYELLDSSVRTRFTRHQIVTEHRFGEPAFRGKVRALAWLTPEDFRQALLQGAIVVDFPDGQRHTFVVGKDNMEAQRRGHNGKDLYFFWGHKRHERGFGAVAGDIKYTSGTVLAGDVDLFGYGKLVLLRYTERWTGRRVLRLAILADTGAAFTGRPDKLDLFVGYVGEQSLLQKMVRTLPDFAHASILVYNPTEEE